MTSQANSTCVTSTAKKPSAIVCALVAGPCGLIGVSQVSQVSRGFAQDYSKNTC